MGVSCVLFMLITLAVDSGHANDRMPLTLTLEALYYLGRELL
jgi:hypothetical protein